MPGRRWLWALLLVGAAVLLFAFHSIFGRLCLLLLLSSTIAYPLTSLSKRLPFSRGLNVGLSLLLVLALLSLLLSLALPALFRQLASLKDSLPQLLRTGERLLQRTREALLRMGLREEAVARLFEQGGALLAGAAGSAAERLMRMGNAAASSWYLLLSPVLAFYMARDRQALFDTCQRLLPAAWRKRALVLGKRVRGEIGEYVRGQMTVSLITGGLTALGLLCIGLPSWLVMGLLMVVCNLIPYFGPVLGILPIVVFSLPYGPWRVLAGVLAALTAQQLESLVVAPKVLGQASGLHPGLVIVSLTAGGWLFGFAGLFFSIPAVLCLRALLDTLRVSRLKALQESD